MNPVELFGALLTGGVAVEIIRRVFAPAELRQIDSTAMRSELWKRVETLEANVKDLSEKIAVIGAERDHEREQKLRYRTAYERADEYVRRQGQAILMVSHLMEIGDETWRAWLARLVLESNSIPNFLPPLDRAVPAVDGGPSPRNDGGSNA